MGETKWQIHHGTARMTVSSGAGYTLRRAEAKKQASLVYGLSIRFICRQLYVLAKLDIYSAFVVLMRLSLNRRRLSRPLRIQRWDLVR